MNLTLVEQENNKSIEVLALYANFEQYGDTSAEKHQRLVESTIYTESER